MSISTLHGDVALSDKRTALAAKLRQVAETKGANLTMSQQRLWFLHQLTPVYRPDHVFAAFELRTELDTDMLEARLLDITHRHECLRTAFLDVGGTPLRVVVPDATLTLGILQRPDLCAEQDREELARLAMDEAQRPFDLDQPPLARVTLLRLQHSRHVLFVTMHRIVADDASLSIFVRELFGLGGDEPGVASAPSSGSASQFSRFAAYERAQLQGEGLANHLEYWTQHLVDLQTLSLPTDRPRPKLRTHHGARCSLALPHRLVESVERLAQSLNTSLFVVLLAAYKIMLARYAGVDDVAIGTPKTNRTLPAFQNLIGPLDNTLVLRSNLSGDPTFAELLTRVENTYCGALLHQDVPFEKLVEHVQPQRDLSQTPIFQAAFALEATPAPLCGEAGSKATELAFDPGIVFYDLELRLVKDAERLRAYLRFNTDLFDSDTAERLLRSYACLLEGLASNPMAPISRLPLMAESERHQMVQDWNLTSREYPRHCCLNELIEAQAALTPNAIALDGDGRCLTYQEMNRQANQLAHYLRVLGVGRETIVAVFAERIPETVVAFLAVLKAGGAYMPLDPEYPADRVDFMLADSGAQLLLSYHALPDSISQDQRTVVCLETDWPQIAACPRTNAVPFAGPTDLAYVIYTSGSTGKPKGVLVPHRQVVSSTSAQFAYLAPTAFLLLLSFAFDASGVGSYWTLCTGGRLVIPTSTDVRDPRRLCSLAREKAISHLDCAPSLYALLLDTDAAKLRSLRYAIVGGEILRPDLVARHYDLLPDAILVNHYGPTEATILCTRFQCTREDAKRASIPIGRPIANARIYLLNPEREPVPVRAPGEIYVGGEGVARGYLNRPELTEERFILDPYAATPGARLYRTGDLARYLPDGNIEFMGRADDQIKLRGYRIELGEIELSLRAHPDVADAAVLAPLDPHGERQIVAYAALRNAGATTAEALSAFLATRLPHFMLPKSLILVDSMPRNPSGKLARHALPKPTEPSTRQANELIAPRSPLEREIAGILVDLLGAREVGVTENLFELGGDSLMVGRLSSRLSKAYAIELPVDRLFHVPTVEGIAGIVELYRRQGHSAAMATWDAPQIEAEVVLDPSLNPVGLPKGDFTDPSNILLTGSTGYIGSYLLSRMLTETRADVHCLVRAPNQQAAMDRIKKSLGQYQLWNETFAARIRPLAGDLAKPMLGLSFQQFAELSETIDVIYHSGAFVNFLYPYSALKAPNVQSTQVVLDLACKVRLKAVHFLSSVDVLLMTYAPRPFTEGDLPSRPGKVPDGYGQSKWVAEKVLALARARGVPVCIYRLGHIMGHTESGECSLTDHISVALKGFLRLGLLPEFHRFFNATPVDYASKVILHISRQEASLGKNFNLWNIHPVTFLQAYEWIRSFGYEFDVAAYPTAYERFSQVDRNHPLYPLLPLLPATWQQPPSVDPRRYKNFDVRTECGNTLKALEGSGLESPPTDEAFFHSCLSYLVRRGFLDPPQAKRAHAQTKSGQSNTAGSTGAN